MIFRYHAIYVFDYFKKYEAITISRTYRKTRGFDDFSKSWNFMCFVRLKTRCSVNFQICLITLKTSNFDDFSKS